MNFNQSLLIACKAHCSICRRCRPVNKCLQMEKRLILTEQDYIDAMREVSLLIDLDPEPNSPEGARLALLGDLVQTYEANYHPM